MCKDLEHDSLKCLDRELSDGENLAVREDVEMCNDDFPEVIDATDVDQSRLNQSAHGKRVNLLKDLTFGRSPGVRLRGEHRRVEVLKHSYRELG